MRFLADEGVDRSIVNGLRLLNFDVYYVIDKVRSLEDDVLLKIAFDEARFLITKDKDFGELVAVISLKIYFCEYEIIFGSS